MPGPARPQSVRVPTEYEVSGIPTSTANTSLAKLGATLLPDESGLQGYLAPTYVLADRGLFFVPGAFKKTASEHMVGSHHLLYHWPDLIIGQQVAAEEDARGLKVVTKLNENIDLGREVMSNYRFGINYGWSLGFDSIKDRSGNANDDKLLDRSGVPFLKNVPINELRAIVEARGWEGSTVPWGSIEKARPDIVQSRSADLDDVLSQYLDDLKAGTLSTGQLTQLEAIAAELSGRAGAAPEGETHSTPLALTGRSLTAELESLFEGLGVDLATLGDVAA
jgi:HK97 family phage prohead protease